MGAILFIIFIADFLFIDNDIDFVSYAYDTTHSVCGQNFSEVIIFLESNVNNESQMISQKGLIANFSKGTC